MFGLLSYKIIEAIDRRRMLQAKKLFSQWATHTHTHKHIIYWTFYSYFARFVDR